MIPRSNVQRHARAYVRSGLGAGYMGEWAEGAFEYETEGADDGAVDYAEFYIDFVAAVVAAQGELS